MVIYSSMEEITIRIVRGEHKYPNGRRIETAIYEVTEDNRHTMTCAEDDRLVVLGENGGGFTVLFGRALETIDAKSVMIDD
jgi:hypothetical protein